MARFGETGKVVGALVNVLEKRCFSIYVAVRFEDTPDLADDV